MKKLTALVTMVFILLAFSNLALAWGGPRSHGEPGEFRPGDSRGYFIWRDGDMVHLRVTTHGREHTFSGVIRTDGHFRQVRGYREEMNDSHRVNHDRDAISFRLHTAGGVDGLDFRVAAAEHVDFDLYMDGHRISPREIYIGRQGWHPERHEFRLR